MPHCLNAVVCFTSYDLTALARSQGDMKSFTAPPLGAQQQPGSGVGFGAQQQPQGAASGTGAGQYDMVRAVRSRTGCSRAAQCIT